MWPRSLAGLSHLSCAAHVNKPQGKARPQGTSQTRREKAALRTGALFPPSKFKEETGPFNLSATSPSVLKITEIDTSGKDGHREVGRTTQKFLSKFIHLLTFD